MNIKNCIITLGTALALLPLGLIQGSQPSVASEILLSQSRGNDCREVDVNTALNVRTSPSGVVINRLEDEDIVYIVGRASDGWIKIRYPVEGYISDKYLIYCSQATSPNNLGVNNTNNGVLIQSEGEEISTVPGSNCRQVTQTNLPVRNKPNGQIVGQLDENQQVMLANEGFNGWVPIEYPISGYISAQYLTDCSTTATNQTAMGREPIATVSGSNCRKIMSPDVPVRSEPMGNIIGQLDQNEEVYIANEGYDGWVPIERPASGYVTSANLGSCTTSK